MLIIHQYFKRILRGGIAASCITLVACNQNGTTVPDTAALVATVTELKTKVAYLSDREQINEVYLRYMRGFDRNDVELLKTAFWPDAQINYGAQSNSFDEFVAEHLNVHTAEFSSWGHLISNKSMDIVGDVAHVEAYVTGLFTPTEKSIFSAGPNIVSGRYIDRLDRRNGKWRIAVREFIPHFWSKSPTFTASSENIEWPQSECSMGTWDKRDPSYRRPLTPRVNEHLPVCAIVRDTE